MWESNRRFVKIWNATNSSAPVRLQPLFPSYTWKRKPSHGLLRPICSLWCDLQMHSCLHTKPEEIKAHVALAVISLYPLLLLFAALCCWAFAEQKCRWSDLQCSWGVHIKKSQCLLTRKSICQLRVALLHFGGRFDEGCRGHLTIVFAYRLVLLSCFSEDTTVDYL